MWDSLFGSPTLKIELMVGKITHVDTERGVYLIQPLDAPDLRKGDTAVSGGCGETSQAFVKNSEVYSINDYVLYARVATEGVQSTTVMRAAIILGRAPAFITSYSDVKELRESRSEKEFTDYYELLATLFDRRSPLAEPDAQFVVRNWLEERMGGDKLLEGRRVLLRVSDELIQILGARCGIHVNSVDSSVVLHGVTLNVSSVGLNKRSALVNDSVIHVTRTAGDIQTAYDAKNDVENFSRETLESDLVYGKISTLYSSKKTPIAQTKELYDGTQRFSSVTGIICEKLDSIEAYSPTLESAIQYDDGIKNRPDSARVQFDRVVESENWKKMHKNTSQPDYLRTPGDRTKVDGEQLTDALGAPISGFKGKASWGFLPNGGFVIRDAWGSEIRMCDGDIQLSAARNIQYVIGQDSIEIVGGAKSTTAIKGIEATTSNGNFDINAAKDINLRGQGNLSTVAGADIRMLADRGIGIKTENDTVMLKGRNVHAAADGEASIVGSKSYVVGRADAMLASGAALIRCDGTVSLASAAVKIFGDISVGDTAYPGGTIGDVKINCGKGSGTIQAVGSIYAGRYLACNAALTVKGAGFFGALATADAQKVEGGYGFGGKLRQSPKAVNINPPAPGSTVGLNSFGAALTSIGEMTKDSIIATMFNIKAGIVNLIRPLFSGKHRNTAKLDKAASIDIEGKTRYIYPGESFWKSSGVVTQTNKTPAVTLLAEELSDKPTLGASDIQLGS